MVDLKQAVDAAKGEIATIEMEGTKQPINNVSSATSRCQRSVTNSRSDPRRFMSGKQASGADQ